jgi:hypothetical protein
MVASPGLPSFYTAQPATVGPPLAPMGHGGLAVASIVQPATAGPAAAVSFNTAILPEASQGPVGPLDPARGPSASPDLVNITPGSLRPGKLILQPLAGLALVTPGAGVLAQPALVNQPEDPPGPAVDSSEPAESPVASQSGQPLMIPSLHHLKAVIHRKMEDLTMEPRLAQWPRNWKLCGNQRKHRD